MNENKILVKNYKLRGFNVETCTKLLCGDTDSVLNITLDECEIEEFGMTFEGFATIINGLNK